MKRLIRAFFTSKPLSETGWNMALLLFRVFAGCIMLPFGMTKIEDYDRYCVDFFGDPIGIGMIPSLWLTIFAQIPCAIALILGLFSRPAATVLTINMAVAVKYHWNDPLATVSLPIAFLAMYVLLMLTGGGRFSLDSLIFKQKTGRRHRR